MIGGGIYNCVVGDCIGPECMVWRWFDTEIKNDGYCGLAGKEGVE